MKPVMLNRQISIERRSATQDSDYGTQVVTWVPLVVAPGSPELPERFWAEVFDIPPRWSDAGRAESVRDGVTMMRNKIRVRMRYRNDVDTTMRVTVHGDTDKVYQIIDGPAEIGGRKAYIEMVCESYSTGGDAP